MRLNVASWLIRIGDVAPEDQEYSEEESEVVARLLEVIWRSGVPRVLRRSAQVVTFDAVRLAYPSFHQIRPFLSW